MPYKLNAITGKLDLVNSPEIDPTAWLIATAQTGLTGDKTGSFNLTTTGTGTFGDTALSTYWIDGSDAIKIRPATLNSLFYSQFSMGAVSGSSGYAYLQSKTNITDKGSIGYSTDFPLIVDVQFGWAYSIVTTGSVTDNAGVEYTNTGQTFADGTYIAWNGVSWTEITSIPTTLPIQFWIDSTLKMQLDSSTLTLYTAGLTVGGDIGGTNITASATLQGSTINATAGFKLVGAATTGTILRGDGTNYTASTLTLPNTTTANRVLFSTSASVIGDDADFTFLTDTLTATKIVAPTSITIGDGTASDARTLTFDSVNDGVFTWSNTSDELSFNKRLLITGTTDSYGRMFSLSKTNYDTSTGNSKQPLSITAFSSTGGSKALYGVAYDIRYTGAAAQTGTFSAMQGQFYHTGAGATSNSFIMNFNMYLASNANAAAFAGAFVSGYVANTYTGTVGTYYGFWDYGMNPGTTGSCTTAYNFYGSAHADHGTGTFTNAYGMLLVKQTVGSTINAGLVLLGDSTVADIVNCGAGIVFGAGNDAALGYDGTDVILNTAIVGTGVLEFVNAGNWTAGGAGLGTLTNAPSAGNPTTWLSVKDSGGTVRKIPAW